MLTFVLKKAKFYQGCRCSFMSLLKINTFRNIFQTFDHISDHKFKAVSFFSKQLVSSQQTFLDFAVFFYVKHSPYGQGWGREGALEIKLLRSCYKT